nr:hypothetical protein [Tanacetum cinerariifolium]
MVPLTFADTHNMVAYLSKSDTNAGFDQIVDFLNAHTIQYALVVNPTIYVSCIKKFLATTTIKKVNDAIQLRDLIDGKKVVVIEDVIRRDLHLDDVDGWKFLIHTLVQCVSAKRTAWNEFSCSMASAVICLAIDDLTSHNTKYTSHALTQKVFANMRRVASPPQEQPTSPHESSMSLLTTIMKTYDTLSNKVAELEQDKQTQALEILKLKKRVKCNTPKMARSGI